MPPSSSAPDPGLGTTRRDRRLHGVVGLWLLLGLVWSVAIPPMEAPDELTHVDFVQRIVDDRSYPRDPIVVQVPAVAAKAWIESQLDGHRFTEEVVPRPQRPSFPDLHSDDRFEAPNQMVQHPPLGYLPLVLVEGFLRVALPDLAFDLHLWALRLSAVLLSAAVPLLIARTVRALGGSPTQCVLGALAPLGIPQLTATMATIGNDLPVVVAAAAAAWAAAAMATGRAGAARQLGAVIGLGALTKGFGLALSGLAAIPLLDRPRRWRPALVTAATAALVGGWWWCWNLSRFGAIQPHGVPLEDLYGPPLTDGPGFGEWFGRAMPLLVDRSWGAFGSFGLGIGLPRWCTAIATLGAVVLVVLGVARSGETVRRFAVAQALVLAIALAVLAQGAFSIFHDHGVLLGVQGRYLFVAVPGLAAVIAMGARVGERSRRPVALALAVIAAMQAFALWQVLQGWWGPAGAGLSQRGRAWASWMPVAPKAWAILCSVLAVGSVVALLPLGRDRRGATPPAR